MKSVGFKSPEWHKAVSDETNSRPTAHLERKPFDFDAHRPQAAQALQQHSTMPSEYEIYKLIGPGSGLPPAAAERLARWIHQLHRRVEVLEEKLAARS